MDKFLTKDQYFYNELPFVGFIEVSFLSYEPIEP